MTDRRPGPLVAAGGDTLLLQLDHPAADDARRSLTRFAHLERAPGLVDTYRLTDLGLWNAKAAGLDAGTVIDTIEGHTGAPVPRVMVDRITESMGRFGPVRLDDGGRDDGPGSLRLSTETEDLLDELLADPDVAERTGTRLDRNTAVVDPIDRGPLKLALTRLRWPADDRAGLRPGRPIELDLRPETELRPYQRQAVEAWLGAGTGVIVLPCGAGKTVTALAAAAETGTSTLILTTGAASMTQWERELARFTTVAGDDVGRYGGGQRRVRPVTLATYQMLATRRNGEFRNLALIDDHDWGLVVYDEVHLLPSAVFGLTAGIQARRRLGLTATLVREDGREADVFTLIGPRRFDVPWTDLELQGWIAPARCTEVRVVADDAERMAHARATATARARVAAGVRAKLDVVETLLGRHGDEPTLIIGTYLDGLGEIAARHDLPLITGETPETTRGELFDGLRRGDITTLVLSKVGNYSLDLPEVSVAIQVSGTFGSRQEEAQRLGRLLRPKADGRQASFYTLVARDTVEQEHSAHRQRFLTEQGYHYEIVDAADL
ncbi:MAG: DNA repair helicase XPB [Actinomycetota bacterium]